MRGTLKLAGSALVLVVALSVPPAAASAAASSEASCRAPHVVGEETEAVELPGTLETPILDEFGVFRRAALPSDQMPPINPAGLQVEFELEGYYPSAIRQVVALANGERVFLVPGLPRTLRLPPLRCVPEALRKRLAEVEEQERKRAAEPAYCLVVSGARRTPADGGCGVFAEVAASRSLFGASLDEGPTVLLVPDGVAAVRVTGPGKRTMTIPAQENAYLYDPGAALRRLQARLLRKLFNLEPPKHATRVQQARWRRREQRLLTEIASRSEPSKVEWLASSGTAIKTIVRPPVHTILQVLSVGTVFEH